MKDILIRSISGFIFIGILIGCILWDPCYLNICLGIFAIISLYEFSAMMEKEKSISSRFIYVGLGSAIYLSLSDVFDLSLGIRAIMLGLPFIILWTSSLWNERNGIKSSMVGTFGWLYCVIPYVMMTWINDFDLFDEGRLYYLLFLFIIVWTNDTFAYLSGRFLGKHKLFERISPKKTWEGTIGGMFFSVLAGIGISLYSKDEIIFWIISAILISIAAIIGDLFESMIKRQVGVKDSGNIMPGHGGILDRFDAAIFAAPTFLIWCFIYFS